VSIGSPAFVKQQIDQRIPDNKRSGSDEIASDMNISHGSASNNISWDFAEFEPSGVQV
jgi:hypothetical protein